MSDVPVVSPPTRAKDPKTGRFLPRNVAAFQHGLRTDRLPPEFEHLRDEVDAFVRDCLSDEGSEAGDIPRRRRALLEYRARLHRRILQVDAALEVHGLFDRRGKLRAGWLQRLEGLIGSAKGLDVLLGLERRQKRIPSIGEVLQGDGGKR